MTQRCKAPSLTRCGAGGAGGTGGHPGASRQAVGAGALVILLMACPSRPQNVRIDPTSLSFNMWKEIPVPFYLSVYFFDIINPQEILQGQKPQVRERGPYVYR